MMLDALTRWQAVRERAWIPIDPDRKCWGCGTAPTRRYPDGSPGYDCGPHSTSYAHEDVSEETRAAWAAMVAADLGSRRSRGAISARGSVGGQAYGLRARARRTDPATSHAAAASVKSAAISELQGWILGALERPLTDEELWNELAGSHRGLTPSGVRTRRSELVDDGRVLDSGLKRPTKAGRPSIAWARSDQLPRLEL